MEFDEFARSWIPRIGKINGPSQKDCKFFSVDSHGHRTELKAEALFVEFQNGGGILIPAQSRPSADSLHACAWPESSTHFGRFVVRPNCSNVVELAIEVCEVEQQPSE